MSVTLTASANDPLPLLFSAHQAPAFFRLASLMACGAALFPVSPLHSLPKAACFLAWTVVAGAPWDGEDPDTSPSAPAVRSTMEHAKWP